MKHRYIVTARNWTPELKERFGENHSLHWLSDTEVVSAIRTFGRASIAPGEPGPEEGEPVAMLEFENEYD